jgi:hypothetical protein
MVGLEFSGLDPFAVPAYSPAAMFYRIGLTTLLAVVCAAPLCGDEPALAPREGVLLLKNGHVMQGGITKAGDFFVLTLGKTGEIRLPAADVETQCVDLDDAYRYQAALLSNKKAEPHLTLAEWCLRHSLKQQAEDQIAFARKLDPENARIAQLELRLKAAAESPVPAPKIATLSTTVGAKQLDETVADLPKGSVEKFSVVIQPMLINRCGANGCHGPAAKSDFHLLRPATGQMMSKRFTQRNLFTVLQFMDKDHPEESRLVTIPQERHGGMQAPIFDKRTQHQRDDLVAWAKMLAPKPPQVVLPTTIGPAETLLTQQGGPHGKAGSKTPPNIAPMNVGEKTDGSEPRPPRAPSVKDLEPGSGSRKPGAPRDPFDPEIFNQKHLPAKP